MMNGSEFLLWSSDYIEGSCVVKPPAGIEKAYQLDEGISRAKGWPADVACKMDPEFPKDIALVDNLYGAGAALVSERLRDALLKEQTKEIEFLPLRIVNHKGRTEPEPYFLMNPLGIVECIDIDASGVSWSRTDSSLISHCDQLVIEAEAVPESKKIFRPKHWSRLILVRASLFTKLRSAGFTGLVGEDPLDYMGL